MNWTFRGWDAVGNKGWVYGDLVHNLKITKEKDVPRVMVGGYEVDPDSLGICTGFKDLNGKLIYEGDIIEATCLKANNQLWQKKSAYVLYDSDLASFVLMEISGKNSGIICMTNNEAVIEVVGNVYERRRKQRRALR